MLVVKPWAESLNSHDNSAEYAIDEENSKCGDRLLGKTFLNHGRQPEVCSFPI